MRLIAASLLSLTLLLAVPSAAQAASWSAGGWLSAAWAGGWPQLDIRARGGWLVGGGHELGLTGGLVTSRLATQLLYLGHYSHTWTGGRRWPVVNLWAGGATDVLGFIAQTRVVMGLSVGLRVPISERVVLRVDFGHELLMGPFSADRTFLAVGLEVLGGRGWRDATSRCYPQRRSEEEEAAETQPNSSGRDS